MLTELESLEGWLLKKKRADKTTYFGSDTRRWFKMQKLKGSSVDELALCYFTNNTDKEPKGWIYLKDVRELSDDGKIMTITSTSRNMIIEAQSRAEHRLWLQGLIDYCPFLTNVDGIESEINLRKYGKSRRDNNGHPQYVGAVDAKGVPCEQRERAFSRFASLTPNASGEAPPNAEPREVDYDYDRQLAPTNTNSRRKGCGSRSGSRDRDRNTDSRGSNSNLNPNSNRDCMDSAGSHRSHASYDEDDDLCHGGVQYNKKNARDRTDSRSDRNDRSERGLSSYGGSTTSRLHSHISKNNPYPNSNSNSTGNLNAMDSNIDVDYDCLTTDKLEPSRIRLNRYANDENEDENSDLGNGSGRDRDSNGSIGLRPLADEINNSLRDKAGVDADAKDSDSTYAQSQQSSSSQPVSHFATNSGKTLSSSRELKLSVDDMLTRSSANTGDGRGSGRGKAPPTAAYSPKIRRDGDDDDDDDIDIQAEKLRYSSTAADSKDTDGMNSAGGRSGEEKMSMNGISRPPLGPSPNPGIGIGLSGFDSNSNQNLVTSSGSGNSGGGKAPPSGAPPSSYRSSSTSPKPLIDSRFSSSTMTADQNFADDDWDEDSPTKNRPNNYSHNQSHNQSSIHSSHSNTNTAHSSVNNSPRIHNNHNLSSDAGSKNISRSSSFNASAGVKEDSNWMDEDFDD